MVGWERNELIHLPPHHMPVPGQGDSEGTSSEDHGKHGRLPPTDSSAEQPSPQCSGSGWGPQTQAWPRAG